MILPRKLSRVSFIEKAVTDIRAIDPGIGFGDFFSSPDDRLPRHLVILFGLFGFSATGIADEGPLLLEEASERCLISFNDTRHQDVSPTLPPSSITDPVELSRLGAALAIEGEEKESFSTTLDAIRVLQKALSQLIAADNNDQITVTVNRLGYALLVLGRLQRDETILNEAVETFRQTLDIVDRQKEAAQSAMIERCLASGLASLDALRKGQPDPPSEDTDDDDESEDEQDDSQDVEDGDEESDNEESDNEEGEIADETDDETDDPGFELVLSGSLQVSAVTVHDAHTNDDESDEKTTLITDPEAEIAVRYETDQGLEYSARLSLTPGTGDDPATASTVLYFSNGFGELRLGQDSGAEDDMYIGGGDFQAGTGGIDGNSENLIDVSLTGSGDATKVSYFTPRINGIQLGTSYTPHTGENAQGSSALNDPEDGEINFDDHVGLGVNWVSEFGKAEVIAAAVASLGQNKAGRDLQSYSIGSGIYLGSLKFGAGYTIETEFNERKLVNFGASYSFDPRLSWAGEATAGAGVAYVFPKDETDTTVFAIGGDLYLAPGLQLLGDVAYGYEDRRIAGRDRSALSSVVAIEVNY